MQRTLPLVLSLLLPLVCSKLSAQEKPPQEKPPEKKPALKAGDAAPFMVADFLAGAHANKPGCPFVMVSNSRKRGVVILCRGEAAASAALEFAKALDGNPVDDQRHRGFVVAYDLDRVKAADLGKASGVEGLSLGIPRGQALDGKGAFERLGLPETSDLAICVVDRKLVAGLWLLSAENFKDRKEAVLSEIQAKLEAAGN